MPEPRLRTWFKCLAQITLMIAFTGLCSAASMPELEYAAPEQSVWTTRLDGHGQADNPLFRVAAALFAQAGIPWHGKSYPAARMFKYLQDGTAQFSMLVKAPGLQDCCLFSRKPIAAVDVRVYHLPGKPAMNKREDLLGKRIITVAGYSYGGLLAFIGDERNQIANHLAQTHQAAFRMLANNRADYVVDYSGPASELLEQEPIAGIQSELLSRQEVYMLLSRSYPDAAKVMGRLEAIAEKLNIEKIIRSPGR